MKIAILSRNEALYSTKSLLKAGELANHTIEVLDPGYCNLSTEKGKAVLYYHDEIIDDIDAIIPRIGTSNTYLGTSVVRHFEAMNVFTVVSADGITHSRDKWTSAQLLAKVGIATPKTVLPSSLEIEEQLKLFLGKPIIIKLLEGTHGEGVILTENLQNALAVIETLNATGAKFLLQEYIEEAKGGDVRVIVVDGEAVGAMKRQCKVGEFRSNLHRGGTSENIKLTSAEEKLSINAAKALGMGVCGVDLLQSKRGPLVVELNSTPGLEGIENTTGKDISTTIIRYIERSVH